VSDHPERAVGVVSIEASLGRAEADEAPQEVGDLAAIASRDVRLVGHLGDQQRSDEGLVPVRRLAADPQGDIDDVGEELVALVVALGHAERRREEPAD
jgi:hypothetical protein